MEGRNPVRAGTLEEYRAKPEFVAEMGERPPRTLTIIPSGNTTATSGACRST